MLQTASLLSVLFVAGLFSTAASASSCTTQFDSPKASYDMSPLVKQMGSYFSADADTYDNFKFFFNICDAASPPATYPSNLCANVTDSTAAVYQVRNTTNEGFPGDCTVLGRTTSQNWSLIDGANAINGVQLTYGNGDLCKETGLPRTYSIRFVCTEEVNPTVPISVTDEPETCSYTVTYMSIYACPTECYITPNGMCDNHGLCSIDPVLKGSRCYCNTGSAGNDCQTAVSAPKTPINITGLLIGLVITLLVLLIVLAVVLYYKVKKLNSDDMAYGKMADGGGEDNQIN